MSGSGGPHSRPTGVVQNSTGVEAARQASASPSDAGEGGKAAVVTGAAGFIGAHLTRRLAGSGRQVRAVDLAPRPSWLSGTGVEYHQLDIREEEALHDVLSGAAVVFHLASAHLEVGAPEEWYRTVNVDAVEGLMRAAARAGVDRVVHTSTVGIYGHVERPPANEASPKRPTNPYEATKLQGEEAARRVAEELGLDVVVLRPGWVYGPGCPRTAKLLRAVARRRFFYVGSGTNLRHPIFISDMVDGFLAAESAAREAVGHPYLIVGSRWVSLRELVETCARVQGVDPPRLRFPRPVVHAGLWGVEMAFRVAGREPPVSRRSLAFFENDNAFDGGAAEAHLGFRARVDLEEGLQQTLAQMAGGVGGRGRPAVGSGGSGSGGSQPQE